MIISIVGTTRGERKKENLPMDQASDKALAAIQPTGKTKSAHTHTHKAVFCKFPKQVAPNQIAGGEWGC